MVTQIRGLKKVFVQVAPLRLALCSSQLYRAGFHGSIHTHVKESSHKK